VLLVRSREFARSPPAPENGVTKSVALEIAESDIRVNAVGTGPTDETGMTVWTAGGARTTPQVLRAHTVGRVAV
jgi:NAD(P)-dependent dehydrogenase (short-subunit alcohol dehydrogenase family)